MINFLISLFFGLLPEIIYYYIYPRTIKNIHNKKILNIVLLIVIYIITMLIVRYNFYMYVLFDILYYLILKFVFKSQITDFFMIVFIELYLLLCSIVCYFLFDNYMVAFILDRILMFVPLFFMKYIRKAYLKYCSMWNRSRETKQPIKSLTLRNISLLIMNVMIVVAYVTLLYISNKIQQ